MEKDHAMTDPCTSSRVANVAVTSKDNAHTANQQKASLQMPTDKTVSVPQCWKCRCLVKAHHGPTIGCEGAGGNCGCILTQEEASRVSVPTESRRPNRICSNCGVELFANYQEAGWNHCDREMKPFGNGCKFDGLFACAGKCQCPANTEMLGEFAASSSLLPVGRQTAREVATWILSNCAARYVNPEGFSQSPQDVINFQIHMAEVKIEAYAASSSLLPVPRQIQVQCEMCDGTGRMHVTHDMAIDAGNLNLSGQLISCGTCGGDGFQIEQAEPNEYEKLASLPVGESRDLHSIICQAVALLNQGDTLKAHTLLRETLAEYVG